jgi:alpha-galactosidase
MVTFKSPEDYTAKNNTIAGLFNIRDYSETIDAKKAWINLGGWQSWNPAFEVEPGKKQPSLKNKAIRQWNTWLTFPSSKFEYSKNIVLAQFITYLRCEEEYLIFASLNNLNQKLPPVQFVINRKENTVTVELADKDKEWKKGDLMAQIEVIKASSYFDAREKLEKIFGSSNKESPFFSPRFEQISFLGKNALGWESWYNHYEKINEKLITDDLMALKDTQNLIKVLNKSDYFDKPVFQIDDGYQIALGDWEWNKKLFPSGPEKITQMISDEGYIPGLWIAPFIVDLRSKLAADHPHWLLRNKKGNLVPAGMNPRWGANSTFYCLDLSQNEVLEHLDKLIDKAINTWGFRYLKLDFLYAGMLEGVHKKACPSYQAFNNAIQVLTKRVFNNKGENVAYLGCGNPMELSYNNLPLSRIGCDTLQHWESKLMKFIGWNGRTSAYLNLKDTLGRALWNKIIFANDPDVIFIRKENCTLTYAEKLLIATVNILFGSQIMYADDPATCNSKEEIELTEKVAKLIKIFDKEEFAVYQTGKDIYKVWSKSGKYRGEISLAKNNHYVRGLYEDF